MKKICVTFLALLAFALCGAENLLSATGASYSVFPGDWNKNLVNDKNLGKMIDPDFDRATEKRKGMLADGVTAQRAVCYNYHWTAKDQRFVTIVADLGKKYAVDSVRIVAFRNNEAYQPGKFEVAVSSDNIEFKELAKGDNWGTRARYERFADVEASGAKCRYVRIKVWTCGSWINISEIGVFGK